MIINDLDRTILLRLVVKLARWTIFVPLFFAGLWLFFSSYYIIPTESVGVVLRFGKFDAVCEPGLHFKLPFGIDEILPVSVKRQFKIEFGFGTFGDTNLHRFGDEQDREKNMVTGDLNTALVEWVVQYHLDDPQVFLFHVRNPEDTLRNISESVMREIIGDRTLEEVTTFGRRDIENSSLVRMREAVKEFQIGIAVDQVKLRNINPPREVQAAFNEVNKAKLDRTYMINIANGEYNKAIPRARGEADQRIAVAEGYKSKRVNEALGDVAVFNALLAEYLKAPNVTRTQIYLQTMVEVIPQVIPKVLERVTVGDKATELMSKLPASGPAEDVQK